MRNQTCCFSGHRKLPLHKIGSIKRQLDDVIEQLIAEGYCYFGAGGALGFDILAELAVLNAKKKYPQVKLILVLPCLSQTDGWSKKDKEIYEKIKLKADKVVYTSQEYTRDCMFKRNRHLVDFSSVCICYLIENKGGTAYTVKYAKEKGIRILYLK